VEDNLLEVVVDLVEFFWVFFLGGGWVGL